MNRLRAMDFVSYAHLTEFVNMNNIYKENILSINTVGLGFVMFYYE